MGATRNEEILIFTSAVPAALFLGGKFIKNAASVIIPRVGRGELRSGTTPRNGAVNCNRHAASLRRFRSPTAHHEHPDVCSPERAPGPAGGWGSERRDDARGDCLRLRPGRDEVSEIPLNSDSELRASRCSLRSGVSWIERSWDYSYLLLSVPAQGNVATSRLVQETLVDQSEWFLVFPSFIIALRESKRANDCCILSKMMMLFCR